MNALNHLRRTVRAATPDWTASKAEIDGRTNTLYLALRAHILAEADLLPKADVVAWLTKKSREQASVWELASKVERGAVRPDNLQTPPANFFEPGHTYRHSLWTFHCGTITAHPASGVQSALGWLSLSDGTWTAYAYDAEGWSSGWTDVTDGEARDA